MDSRENRRRELETTIYGVYLSLNTIRAALFESLKGGKGLRTEYFVIILYKAKFR